jgi:hypothetical protein
LSGRLGEHGLKFRPGSDDVHGMPLRAPTDDVRAGASRAALARELGRLDAYSFFTVPADPSWGADLLVVGTTGAFLVKACGLPGLASVQGRRPVVGDRAVPGIRPLRAGARRATSRLRAASVLVEVEPVVCLTEAIAGSPTTGAGGVRFVRLADVARDLTARPSVQSHTRAQRAARTMGMEVAGDRKRHFAVRSART